MGINALMYRKVYQKRVKATILFATETGRSRNYANVVKDVFGRVFAVNACCMEEYDKAKLEHEQLLIIVTSTFGSGDPPANGEVHEYMYNLGTYSLKKLSECALVYCILLFVLYVRVLGRNRKWVLSFFASISVKKTLMAKKSVGIHLLHSLL